MSKFGMLAITSLLLGGCVGEVSPNGDPGDNPGPGPGDGPDITPIRPEPEADFVPIDPLVRRLTRDEFRYTVADVLGVSLSDEEIAPLPVDRPLEGFVNTSSGQTLGPEHVRAFSQIAEIVANKSETATFIRENVNCTDKTQECGRTVVASLGAILFRRPLTDREIDAFTMLFAEVGDEDVNFDRVAQVVVQTMLQAPQFLYRLEVERIADFNGPRVVTGYEMATRLSYLLWASAPDAELYAAAESGAFDTPEGVQGEVARMFGDTDKVNRVIERFLLDWALLEALPDEDGLKDELTASAAAFYSDHIRNERPIFDLLTEKRAFLTPALATAYGLESAGNGIREYDTSGLAGRGGLLAQPGIVAGMTNADGGEIVARGLFLQRQLFCGETPDPPETLEEAIDEFVAEQPPDASQRMIAETRLMRSDCASCHSQFDPLAYGFEQFDFRGAVRTEDEFGNPVQGDGWIPGTLTGNGQDLPYADIDELFGLLKTNNNAQVCLTQRQLEYALGSRLHADQLPLIEALRDQFVASGGSYRSLIDTTVEDDLFRVLEVE